MFFFYYKYMLDKDAPQGVAFLDPMGMVGRIYKEDYFTLLQTKYKSYGPPGLREE